ncbi:MAG: hypothetical protein QY322_03740 [bacterium]|nr:MAG: hypothetical protein QY322_03740 [bacterium]
MLESNKLIVLGHRDNTSEIATTKFQTLKPKDGDGYTWRRVRKGEWTRISTLPPDDIFPPEATVSQEVHEHRQRTTGSGAAHTAEKYDD